MGCGVGEELVAGPRRCRWRRCRRRGRDAGGGPGDGLERLAEGGGADAQERGEDPLGYAQVGHDAGSGEEVAGGESGRVPAPAVRARGAAEGGGQVFEGLRPGGQGGGAGAGEGGVVQDVQGDAAGQGPFRCRLRGGAGGGQDGAVPVAVEGVAA